jgi:hypothetical protein
MPHGRQPQFNSRGGDRPAKCLHPCRHMQWHDLVDGADAELLTVGQKIRGRPQVRTSGVRVPDRGGKEFQEAHLRRATRAGHQSRHGKRCYFYNQFTHKSAVVIRLIKDVIIYSKPKLLSPLFKIHLYQNLLSEITYGGREVISKTTYAQTTHLQSPTGLEVATFLSSPPRTHDFWHASSHCRTHFAI